MREIGLRSTVADEPEAPDPDPTGGGTDDIGDLHWNFPVANLFYPSNIPGATGHHWSSGVAMATSIAHKGAAAGAKALAATVIDLVTRPQLVADAKAAFAEQTKGQRWVSLIPAESTPPIELNADKIRRGSRCTVGRTFGAGTASAGAWFRFRFRRRLLRRRTDRTGVGDAAGPPVGGRAGFRRAGPAARDQAGRRASVLATVAAGDSGARDAHRSGSDGGPTAETDAEERAQSSLSS